MKRSMLVLVAAVCFGWIASPAHASKPPSPSELAIYVRGWIDGAAPPGVYVVRAKCSTSHLCVVTLNNGGCATATVSGYAFAGPWHRCKQPRS